MIFIGNLNLGLKKKDKLKEMFIDFKILSKIKCLDSKN